MSGIYTVSLFEIKNMRKNPVFWLGWGGTILWALIWDSPLRHGELWLDRRCAFRFGHGIVTLGIFIIAIIFANAFRIDRITKSPMVIFTQPINRSHYALGKFLGIFLVTLLPILMGLALYLLIPLAFGEAPYSPSAFIEVLGLYIIPSLFSFSALCYAVVVLCREFLFAALIPIILFLQLDSTMLSFRIAGEDLTLLTYGTPDGTILDLAYTNALANRGIIVAIGIVIVSIAIFSYASRQSKSF